MKTYLISHYNGYRGEDELVIYDRGESTKTNKYGFEACVCGGRVISCGGNNSVVPEDGFVVSGHGKAAIFLADALCVGAKLNIQGDEIIIEVDFESHLFLAEERISTIEKRIDILGSRQMDYDSKNVKDLLNKAYAAEENGDFDAVKELTERAYYLTAETAKNEIRGVWHRPKETSDDEVEKTVIRFAESGINLMLVETNYGGYANALRCVTDYLPVREEYKNGFDVIESFIKIGKKHGVEIHAWFENFFFGHSGAPCAIAEIHPEWMAMRKDGGLWHDGYDIFYFLNPALPEVRDFLLSLCKELLDKYDFDGLQLDYIRYPLIHGIDRAAGFDNASKSMFLGETGIDIDKIPDTECEEWKKYTLWCAEKVSKYVESVNRLIKEYRTDGRYICLSTAVVGAPEDALYSKCQDWRYWVKQGWLDAIYPMAYYNNSTDVEDEIAYMVKNYGDTPNISGIAPMYNRLPLIETTKQIEACRRAGAKGIAFFSAAVCSDEELEKLKIGAYRKN